MPLLLAWMLFAAAVPLPPELVQARDAGDRAGLQRIASNLAAEATKKEKDAAAQYRAAVAHSFLAEAQLGAKDKGAAKVAAESGIKLAENAVAIDGGNAEYHRILGTLCGQVIPANVWAGLKYGRCALDEINKAIELDGRSALAYLSRGVGNYYLPTSFGGGMDPAIRDFRKALELDPKLADAYMWLGIALREKNQNKEARAALQRAVELNPKRVWAKQQLEKTPAQ